MNVIFQRMALSFGAMLLTMVTGHTLLRIRQRLQDQLMFMLLWVRTNRFLLAPLVSVSLLEYHASSAQNYMGLDI